MAKVKSEIKVVFEGEGLLNSDNSNSITLENEDVGIVDISEILKRANGKITKIVITTTDVVDIPTIKE